jgi:hypothetical protein
MLLMGTALLRATDACLLGRQRKNSTKTCSRLDKKKLTWKVTHTHRKLM